MLHQDTSYHSHKSALVSASGRALAQQLKSRPSLSHTGREQLISCYHSLLALSTLWPEQIAMIVYLPKRFWEEARWVFLWGEVKNTSVFFSLNSFFSLFRQNQMSGLAFLYVSDMDVFCYKCEYLCLQVFCTFKWFSFSSFVLFWLFSPLTSVITPLPKPWPFPRYWPHYLWVLLH